MSLLEKVHAYDGQEIEHGKRLIRAADAGGTSFVEWVTHRLHRLAWRSPIQRVRLRGRFPLKLLAVPKDPIAGDKATGEALLHGYLVVAGHNHPIEKLDFADPGFTPDLSDYLQASPGCATLAAAATREKGRALAEHLVQRWLAAHGEQHSERAWRADLWGRRILFCTAYAPYILSRNDLVYRSTLLNALARGARYLERAADRTPAGLPRITAWAGVIAAALLIQGGTARLGKGEGGLLRALAWAMHDDGGLTSRSPAEQVLLVELLAQLRAVYFAVGRELPEPVAEALSGATAALLGVTLGDEALSSWQGGNMLNRRRVAAAVEGSGVTTRPLRQARGWGYQRLSAKNSVVVLDAAPPPPARARKGGCASTLAFELSDGAQRIVVNCGGAGEEAAALPPALVQGLRTTAAHSTITIGDRNSTAILEDGSLGRGVTQVELSRDEAGGVVTVEAGHDGYCKRFGLMHQRRLTLSADGGLLEGEDVLLAARKRRRAEPVAFAARFHLAPGVEVTSTADGQGALLRIRGGNVWQFKCRGGRLAIEESLWIDGSARQHAATQLVIAGEAPPEGTTITWHFKRAG
jgi:uncharacterized heparinase superfamily protein